MSHLRTPAHPVGLIKSAIKNPTNCQMLNRQFQPAKSMDRWRVEAGAGAGELGPPLDPIPSPRTSVLETRRRGCGWNHPSNMVKCGTQRHSRHDKDKYEARLDISARGDCCLVFGFGVCRFGKRSLCNLERISQRHAENCFENTQT